MDVQEDHMPTLRVLKVLEELSKADEAMTLSQLARACSCPKSTLSPIVRTLAKHRYICCGTEDLSYSLGSQAFVLGNSYQFEGSILDIIQQQMEELVGNIHEISHLGVLSGKQIVYLKKVTPSKPMQLLSLVGKKLPAYATALGKALLQDHSKEELLELFPEEFEAFTEHTLKNAEALYADIHQHSDGFAYETEEIAPYARCIALPLRYKGSIVAALSVSFMNFDLSQEKIEQIKSQLKQSVNLIEKIMKSQGFYY